MAATWLAAVEREPSLAPLSDEARKVTPARIVDDALASVVVPPTSTEELEALYKYRVPVTTDDGSCAASKELAEEPFDLAKELLGGWAATVTPDHAITATLQRLNVLVRALAARVDVDWLGVYRLQPGADPSRPEGRYLVKLAYVGRPSRAIFPLNPLFHDISNNSWVAMEGRPKLIQDVASYDGPYYACDGDVQSELCAPIISEDGTVLGIIDAESFQKRHFNAQRVADILQACADLGRRQLGFV